MLHMRMPLHIPSDTGSICCYNCNAVFVLVSLPFVQAGTHVIGPGYLSVMPVPAAADRHSLAIVDNWN